MKHLLTALVLAALWLGVNFAGAQVFKEVNGPATFTGSVTVTTGQFLAPAGTVSVPAYSFTADPDSGYYWSSSGATRISSNTNNVVEFLGNDLTVHASGRLGIGSVGVTNADTYFTRSAAGTMRLTGEFNITTISGAGKAVCIKANGNLGTCTDAVGAGGTCTCS